MGEFETASYIEQKTDGNGMWREVRVIDEDFEVSRGRGAEKIFTGMNPAALRAGERVRSLVPFDFCGWRGKSYKDFRDFCVAQRFKAVFKAAQFVGEDTADLGGGLESAYTEAFVEDFETAVDRAIQAAARRIRDARKRGNNNPLIDDDEALSVFGSEMFDFRKFEKTADYKAFARGE